MTLTSLISTQVMSAVEIGQKAPGFELVDHDGKTVKLEDYKDKLVVLEWYNMDCPFVRKFYDPKKMQEWQALYGNKEVVWLKIISSAPGKQGYLDQAEAKAQRKKEGAPARLLLDPTGVVGRAYDAKTTPHMYIINDGVLVYQGAIDSIRSTKASDIDKADNYVLMALEEIAQGKPVTVARTQAYGCSVKY
jgi:hypothetical protein